MNEIGERLTRLEVDVDELEMVGVPYSDWRERWIWESVTSETCFRRFNRLQPAMDEARRRNDAIWLRYASSSKSTLDVSFRDDTAHKTSSTAATHLTTVSDVQTMMGRVVRVFSSERLSTDGLYSIWSFIAADYLSIWNVLEAKKCHDVQGNEVIEEHLPCHLYFDLEFQKATNAQLHGDVLVLELLRIVERILGRRWKLSMDDAFVMEMDASTEAKFSRHLIIRFRNHAFQNNAHMKAFVDEVMQQAPNEKFIVKKDDVHSSFVDEAVYSRNRSFRMLWCSKTGKKNQLKPTRRFSLRDFAASGRQTTRRLFFLSLITNVLPGVEKLEMTETCHGIRGWGSFPMITTTRTFDQQGRCVEICQKGAADYGPCYYQERAIQHIPTVEHLIYHLSNLSATVKKIVLLGYNGMASYSLSGPGAHYCTLIGRSHKSNYVYYLLNLQSMCYQQRCHDYECDNSKSRWTPLPDRLIINS